MPATTAVSSWHEQGLTPAWLGVMHSVAAVVLGLLLLVHPTANAVVLAGTLGAYWLVGGVLGFVAVMMDRTTWGVKVGSGVLGILGGLWVIRSPLWSDAISPERSLWIAGLLGVAIGTSQLIVSPADEGSGWRLVGALSILIGIGLAFNPVGRFVALPVVLGLAALLAGGTALLLTWRARGSTSGAPRHGPPEGPSGPSTPNSGRSAGEASAAPGRRIAQRNTVQSHASKGAASTGTCLLGGRYRLAECTHVDRIWEIWRGTDAWTGRPVTIRVTTQKHSGDAYVRRCGEALLAASSGFADPRVVPVLDAGTDECGDYLVSGATVEPSLEGLIGGDSVPAESVTRMAMELCRLLTRARQMGVVHGPVLPSTLFFGPDGSLKVSDFFVGDPAAPLPLEARSYAAPEQRTAVVGSPAEAVYNVGALLGATRGAEKGGSASAFSRAAGLAGWRSEAETGLHAVWRKAVAPHPSLRYRDLAQMMDDLRVLDELQTSRSRVRPAAGVLSMGIALALLAANFSTTYVSVPSVVGMDSTRAVGLLEHAGLVPQAPPDARPIMVQEPPAGTVVAARTTVRLTPDGRD